MRISRWLIYTVIVAALPILVRLLIYMLSNHISTATCISPVDIVFFGLTLNISNINEINNLRPRKNKKGEQEFICKYRDNYVGLSTIFIVLLSIPLGALYMAEMTDTSIIDTTAAFIGAMSLGLVSLLFSGVVIYQLIKLQRHGDS